MLPGAYATATGDLPRCGKVIGAWILIMSGSGKLWVTGIISDPFNTPYMNESATVNWSLMINVIESDRNRYASFVIISPENVVEVIRYYLVLSGSP
jgi:hypothetical protein